MKNFWLLFFLIILLCQKYSLANQYGLSLTDSLKYPRDFPKFSYVNKDAPKKGSLNIGVVGSFDSVNNNILMGSAADGLYLTGDSLFIKSVEELATVYNLLAEYFYLDHKNSRVIFKIRDIAKWHYGSKITNQDFSFSYRLLKESGHPYYKIMLNKVNKIEELADNKIAYYIDNLKDYDLIQKIGLLPILSQKYYSKNNFNQISLKAPLASGPYKIKEIKAGKYIIYEKYNNYWGKDLNVNIGRYNFLEIKYSYFRDSNIAVQNLKAGNYDLRYENIAKNWANNYGADFLEKMHFQKYKIAHKIPTGMQCFILNLRKDKFKDKKIREALNLAFDFEWTNQNLFHSSYERSNSFFSNSPYIANKKLNKRQIKYLSKYKAEDYLYQEPYTPLKTLGDGDNRKNLILAQKLLKEAGWQIKNFKLTNDLGEIFTMEFLITSPSFQRVILPYIKNLEKLGIEAKIKMVDFSNYQKSLENFNFDVTIYVYPGVVVAGNEQINFWHSKYANLKGGSNIAGISNILIDQIVEDIIATTNYKEKSDLTKLLDRVLRNNIYVIPHWNITNHRFILNHKIKITDEFPHYGLDTNSWWHQ